MAMKKYVCMISLLVVIKLNSQIPIVIKIGLNVSNLKLASAGAPIPQSPGYTGSPTQVISPATLIAPYFGVYTNFQLSKKITFQPELIYSMEGSIEHNGMYQSTGGNTYTFLGYTNDPHRINKIDFNFIGKYKMLNHFDFLTGPQLGYVLSGYVTNKLPIAWQFGGSYKFLKVPLNVEIKYALGLGNIVSARPYTSNGISYDESEKLNVIQVGLNYNLFKK